MSEESKIPITLALTMGLPASGKTTLAERISQFYKQEDKDKDLSSASSSCGSAVTVIILSYDSFVPALVQEHCAVEAMKEEVKGGESMTKIVRRKFIQFVKVVVKRIQDELEDNDEDSLKRDFPPELSFSFKKEADKILNQVDSIRRKDPCPSSVILLLDDNHYYSSMRSEFFSLAKQFRLGFCILYCKTSVKTCRARNSLRGGDSAVPDRSIVEMSLKLEEPSPMGNECDAFTIVLNDDEGELDEKMALVHRVLKSSLKNPVLWEPPPDRTEEIERERRICEESEVHQADKMLRKWVSKEMGLSAFGSGAKGRRAELGKVLNEKRVKALELLRTGEYKVAARVDQDVEFTQEIISLVSNIVL